MRGTCWVIDMPVTLGTALLGGVLMGLGYTTGAGAGYVSSNAALARQKAMNTAREYMYEQIYRVYIDYHVSMARLRLGLRFHGFREDVLYGFGG